MSKAWIVFSSLPLVCPRQAYTAQEAVKASLPCFTSAYAEVFMWFTTFHSGWQAEGESVRY